MKDHNATGCSCTGEAKKACTVNRRQFLFASGATTFAVMVTMPTRHGQAEQADTFPGHHAAGAWLPARLVVVVL